MITREELIEERLVDSLNTLIKHDRAAFDLCDAAATRLGAIRPRARVREIGDGHLRRVERLSKHVRALGGLPTREKAELAHGRDSVTKLSSDRHLLEVLLEDEALVANAYERAADRQIPLESVATLVGRARRHQMRDTRWLQKTLGSADHAH